MLSDTVLPSNASRGVLAKGSPVETAPERPEGFLNRIGEWIEESGELMYVLAPIFMVIVAILPFPAEIPAMVNGMVFGPLIGTACTWSGAMLGAWISFELARRWGRPLAERILKQRMLDHADRLALSARWPVLILLRLLPTVAFTAINWTAGFTLMQRSTFLWTTAIGILPGTVLFTVSGSGLAALYWRYPGLTLVFISAAIILLVMITRIYYSGQPDL